jgi:8-oxo-dGTP pyrophosphatase MutT (NUDIX family)
MKNSENPWKKISESIVYENKWIRVEEHDVINPAGKDGIYGKVHFKNKAMGIIPLDFDNHTWLVGQYRYPLDRFSWEIPEGGGAVGTDFLESAKRELKEETGLVANRWTELLRLDLSNSVSDEEAIIFLAEDIHQEAQALEDTEKDLKIKKIPFLEALEMVMQGEITDSISVAGVLALARIKGW